MSRKNGARNRVAKPRDAATRQIIERLIEKQRFKDAYKQAKVCFRQDGSPENRRLLERTYLLRIQELARCRMPDAAREVALNLLEFGVSDASLLPDLVPLLPTIGMAGQAASLSGRLSTPEVHASISMKLADRAVIHPDQAPSSMPELLEGAQKIRAALAAVDDGNDSLAGELLKEIPRSSPWADWRYFARGLAALRRGDMEQTLANWDRLAPERSARRIAEVLRRAATANASPGPSKTDLSMIEAAVFGESVLGRLGRLGALTGADPEKPADWKQAVALMASLRQTLVRIDPRLAQRLTEVLLGPLKGEALSRSWESGSRLVRDFTKAAEPLPLDPNWNRLWALLWEAVDDFDEAIKHWRRYVDDLEKFSAIDEAQRRRLLAIVWRHMAGLFAEESDPNSHDSYYTGPTKAELGNLRTLAIEALERSEQLDPSQRATYDARVALHRSWNQGAQMARAAERLLVVFPDDIDTLRLLIEHHVRDDEPELVLRHVERARALKPLDAGLLEKERGALLALARHRALKGRWDEGRAAFDRAAQTHASARDFQLVASQAAFEFKAGETDRGYELVDEAISLLPEPAAAWLSLAIEAARYTLPGKLKETINKSFRSALAKKTTGPAAGTMAEILSASLAGGWDDAGREERVRDVVAYLRRTSRTHYAQADLVKVCLLLEQLPQEAKLLQSLARRGMKAYPGCATFLRLGAAQELAKGPFAMNLNRARTLLERALAIALKSDDPADGKQADLIKRQFLLLDDLGKAMSAAGRFGGLPFMEEILGWFGEHEDDDDEDDEDDDVGPRFAQGGPFFSAFGGAPPRGGRRKRK